MPFGETNFLDSLPDLSEISVASKPINAGTSVIFDCICGSQACNWGNFAWQKCYSFSSAVSQLRGHWEDTSGKVQARKNQLEELTSDNRQLEAKHQEVEAWLARMEAWQARLRPVGTTQDVLDQQGRELKV